MFFSELKAKTKSTLTEWSFQNFLASYVVGMFKYNGVPVSDPYGLRLLELHLLIEGKGAVFYSDKYKRWISGKVSFTGDPLDEYGTLPDCSCFDKGGNEYKFKNWKENEKCFVFFNNRSRTPDITIERFADLMAKIDISLNANIVNSRMSPIVVAKDSNAANQIKEILKNNHDGATEVITSTNILTDGEDLKVLNITDVNASDKIQYLSHAHDDLLRRFLAIYGINITGTGKMAQQSIKEINGNKNMSFVIPYEMMYARKDTLDRMSTVLGTECTIEFNEAWEREEKEADAELRKIENEAEARKEQGAPESEDAGVKDQETEQSTADDEEGKE